MADSLVDSALSAALGYIRGVRRVTLALGRAPVIPFEAVVLPPAADVVWTADQWYGISGFTVPIRKSKLNFGPGGMPAVNLGLVQFSSLFGEAAPPPKWLVPSGPGRRWAGACRCSPTFRTTRQSPWRGCPPVPICSAATSIAPG